jgi:hypothetical protein
LFNISEGGSRTEAVQLTSPDDNVLLCPKCGRDNLHHGRVSVYQCSEAQAWVQRTIIDETVSSNAVIGDTSNPSPRRHGLTIAFSCEQCGDIGELTIAQHKGQTLINWR